MVYCAAVGCSNDSRKSEGVGFYKLTARNPELQRIWLQKLKREYLKVSKHTVVCSVHFADDAFERDLQAELLGISRPRKLKEDAVPSIFSYGIQNVAKRRTSTEDRLKKKRRQEALESILDNESSASQVCSTDNLGEGETAETLGINEKETQTDTIIYPTQRNQGNRRTESHGTQTTLSSERKQVHQSTQYEITDVDCTQSILDLHSYSRISNDLQREKTPSTTIPSNPRFTSTPITKSDPISSISFSEDESNDQDIFDTTYEPESENESFDDSFEFGKQDEIYDRQSEPHRDEKYIIFQSALSTLFQRCQICGETVLSSTYSTIGTLVKVISTCVTGHDFTWYSQPLIRRMPAGNLLTAAALLFTGCSFSQMKHFADTLNLRFFNSATYNKIQGDLFKVVNEAWLLERAKVQKEVENKMLWLAGDGRCDSPGFSAKYGTYTLLDQETGKIVDFDVIHVSEVNNKSTNMEKEGMKRSLERVISKASVCVLATDRHVQIGYSLRTDFPEITHQYDVWHVSKSISKKLNAKSKIKGCEDLKMWIQAIINHFWWSVSTCNGNPDLLKEKCISVIHHCVDIHSWNSCDLFHACAHAPIPPEVSKNKQWLKRSSKCHEQLKVVVLDKFLLRSLEKLTLFCHTGELEVYNSMMLKYCPKKQHFSYEGMVARTQLAALDHNNGTERDQAVVQKGERAGELMYKQVFPKCSKRWVLKPIYVKKNFNFRKDLMSRTVEVRKEKIALPAIQKPNLPKNIATAPKPSRDEAIESHRSRMTAAHKDV